MGNKIFKTSTIALMVLSAGAISGCSGIKSYKNKVAAEEFEISLNKAIEKYSEEVDKTLTDTYKKSFDYDEDNKTKSNITSMKNETKSETNEITVKFKSVSVDTSFDGYFKQ